MSYIGYMGGRGPIGLMGPMGRIDEVIRKIEHGSGLATGRFGELAAVSGFLRCLNNSAVDGDVFELGAEGVANGEAGFGSDVHIFEGDVAQWALGEARQMAGSTAIFGGEI